MPLRSWEAVAVACNEGKKLAPRCGQGSQRSNRPINRRSRVGIACSSVGTSDYLNTELLRQGTRAANAFGPKSGTTALLSVQKTFPGGPVFMWQTSAKWGSGKVATLGLRLDATSLIANDFYVALIATSTWLLRKRHMQPFGRRSVSVAPRCCAGTDPPVGLYRTQVSSAPSTGCHQGYLRRNFSTSRY